MVPRDTWEQHINKCVSLALQSNHEARKKSTTNYLLENYTPTIALFIDALIRGAGGGQFASNTYVGVFWLHDTRYLECAESLDYERRVKRG